ncbi:MAG: type II toxin-antitoxin system RelE/ParE family toxin [Candidatus Peregrinibacteria bacterium]
MEIKFFNRKIGSFIENLEKPVIAKTLRTLDLLEKFENKLGMPHSKKVDSNLFELRIRGKKEIRIIYCFHKNTIVLLYAFIKKTQKIPRTTIALARKLLNSIDQL